MYNIQYVYRKSFQTYYIYIQVSYIICYNFLEILKKDMEPHSEYKYILDQEQSQNKKNKCIDTK